MENAENEIVPVLVKLEAHAVAEIDRLCGGKGGGRGRFTGRSRWIRQLIYRALKLPEPEGSTTDEKLDFSHVDRSSLDRKTRLLVTLYEKGYRYEEIAQFLIKEKVPAPRGGTWRKAGVRRTLVRLAAKAAAS